MWEGASGGWGGEGTGPAGWTAWPPPQVEGEGLRRGGATPWEPGWLEGKRKQARRGQEGPPEPLGGCREGKGRERQLAGQRLEGEKGQWSDGLDAVTRNSFF